MRGPPRWALLALGLAVAGLWITQWSWAAGGPLLRAVAALDHPALWATVYLLPAGWVAALELSSGAGRRRWRTVASLFATFALAPLVVGGTVMLLTIGPVFLTGDRGAYLDSAVKESFMGLLFVPPIWGLEVLVALGWTAITALKRLAP